MCDETPRIREVAADQCFPRWLAVLGLIAGVAQVALWGGTIMRTGPLAADGWLSYALYPLVMIWLIPTAVVLIRRLGEPQPARSGARDPRR